MITEIMHLDNGFDDLSNKEHKKQRQLVLQDKVDAYFEWVKLTYSQVTHNSTISKALAYSLNQEEYLRMFMTDGRIPMDNNYAEQAIRPFPIARMNFVLMDSNNGAKSSAIIFSIAVTAKANAINTYEYFKLLLSEIPKYQNDNDTKLLDDLLPCPKNVHEKCPSRFKKS